MLSHPSSSARQVCRSRKTAAASDGDFFNGRLRKWPNTKYRRSQVMPLIFLRGGVWQNDKSSPFVCPAQKRKKGLGGSRVATILHGTFVTSTPHDFADRIFHAKQLRAHRPPH